MPRLIAVPTRCNDVRERLITAFVASNQVLSSTQQLGWAARAVHPHAQPAVVTLAILAIESDLTGTACLACHRNSQLIWKVPVMAKAYVRASGRHALPMVLPVTGQRVQSSD